MIQYSENSANAKSKAVIITDKVLVEIKATQQYGHDTDITDLTTYGTLRDDGAAYIIKYNEELENPSETVCVTVRVQKDESFVEMTRSGINHACLTIEKSKRNLCSYGTDFGNILMGIYGRDIEANAEDGLFKFEYDIDFNGSVSSQNKVRMKLTKTRIPKKAKEIKIEQ